MRRMRLGDKSIERDAARIRALLGPGGAAGGNFPQYVAPMRGYNTTDSAYVEITFASLYSGVLCKANKEVYGRGSLITPAGYTGTMTVYSIFYIPWGDTMRFLTSFAYMAGPMQAGALTAIAVGGLGTYETRTGTDTNRAYAVAGLSYAVTQQVIITLMGTRLGTHSDDTSNNDSYLLGWWISYA